MTHETKRWEVYSIAVFVPAAYVHVFIEFSIIPRAPCFFSPAVFSGFPEELGIELNKASSRDACGVIGVPGLVPFSSTRCLWCDEKTPHSLPQAKRKNMAAWAQKAERGARTEIRLQSALDSTNPSVPSRGVRTRGGSYYRKCQSGS